MSCCAVASCNNYYRKTKGQNISYHPFPKDPGLHKLWNKKCERPDKFNPKHVSVCSVHFTPDQFEPNPQNELLGIPYKKPLKKTAIPTLHLGPLDPETDEYPASADDLYEETTNDEDEFDVPAIDNSNIVNNSKKPVKRCALQHLENVYLSPQQTYCDKSVYVNFADEGTLVLRRELERLREDLRLSKENEKSARLSEKIARQTINKLRKAQMLALERQRNLHSNVLKRVQRAQASIVETKVRDALKGVFTSGQIKMLLNGGKRVKWTAEDISSAIELKAISTRAYKVLRLRGFPLPDLATLRKRTKGTVDAPATATSFDSLFDFLHEYVSPDGSNITTLETAEVEIS